MWQLPALTNKFFTADQRAKVDNLFEAILPGDETSPGARDARAADYIDSFLGLDETFYYEIAGWKKQYAAGLPALDQAASKFGKDSVADLSRDEVTQILTDLSQGKLDPAPVGIDQKGFFAMLRSHCIEGSFADPRWKGNAEAVVWRWFGYLQPRADFERGKSGELIEKSHA